MLIGYVTGFMRVMIRYREPLMQLAAKEVKVRYRDAVLGFLWSVLNPVVLMVVLTMVFLVIKPGERDLGFDPKLFPVFVLCGLVPWNFMARSLSRSATSLVEDAALIQKVYFPREIIPVSAILAGSVNFLISLVVLFVFLLAFRLMPSIYMLMVPVIIAGEFLFVLGISLAASSLNVFYRDVAHIVESLLLVWWWATPVFYPKSLVEDRVPQLLYRLYLANPMAAVVVSLRQTLIERRFPDPSILVTLYVIAVATFMLGIVVFRRRQAIMADFL